MYITDGKLIFCHGISDLIRYNKIPMIYYNHRTPFPVDYGIPYFNLPHMPINHSPCPKKSRYTPDPLPAAIYIVPEKSIFALTAPCDQVTFLTYDDPSNYHITMKDEHDCDNVKNIYCHRSNNGIRF